MVFGYSHLSLFRYPG